MNDVQVACLLRASALVHQLESTPWVSEIGALSRLQTVSNAIFSSHVSRSWYAEVAPTLGKGGRRGISFLSHGKFSKVRSFLH